MEARKCDDESLKRYFDFADKIVDTQAAGADQCYDLAKKKKKAVSIWKKWAATPYHKDSKKRQFNWTLTLAAGAAMLSIGAIVYLVNRDERDGHLELPPSGS